MESVKTPFEQKLFTSVRLSPMVINIRVLMEAVSNDALNFRQLAAVLSQYPVISGRLLSLANSAWVAPVSPITTVESACSRLGTSVVKSVSIAIAVASSFNAASCPSFDMERFWTNSILVSEAAFLLASQLPQDQLVNFPKTAQTAGILHGLGLLWLAENLPNETSLALQRIEADGALSLNDALMDCTGTDYCQVGAWIGKQWKLPEVLVVVIQRHLDSSYREQDWKMAQIIGAALQMVTAISAQRDLTLPNDVVLPINDALLALNVDNAQQGVIFHKLVGKYAQTRALARELFL
ncbi:MAG: HDOD domain-containing protein [Methylococcaceae bacterium]|nr:HDOD domain-containing protein [Methylococcaceae bacterium]